MSHYSTLHERLHEFNSTMRDISVNLEILYIELVPVCLLVCTFRSFQNSEQFQVPSRFADSDVCSY